MTTEYHAEHVGSLLRPPWLLEARESHAKGTLSSEALREAEDGPSLRTSPCRRKRACASSLTARRAGTPGGPASSRRSTGSSRPSGR